jgi:hypothetical protein
MHNILTNQSAAKKPSKIRSLTVQERPGEYRNALPEEVIAAAQSILQKRFRRGTVLSSPTVVRRFLVTKYSPSFS